MVNLRISWSSKAIIILAFLLAVDAHAQSWEAIAPMLQARYDSKCVELKNGLILVAGGQDNTQALSECELYNPITNKWTVTGSLNQARYRHSLIALDDGRALAIGGLINLGVGTTASCELYDPTTGTWTFTDSLSEPSEINSALKLPDGRVFIAGGADANIDYYLDLAYLYDPTTETLQRLPDMGYARTGLVIYCSPSEDTLMACGGNWGGLNGFYFRTTVVYSFATNQWTLADSSIEPHDNGQTLAIEMPDNKPLLVSGRTGPNTLTQNIEAFDWNSETWTHVGQVFRAQWHCYAFRVGNDSIVLVGGSTPDYQNVTKHTTWYQYSTGNSWAGADMLVARYLYTGLLYDLPSSSCSDSEYIYVFGGGDTNNNALASCERLAVGVISEPGSGPTALTLATTTQNVSQSACAALDTSVALGLTGCSASSGMLDSVWLTTPSGASAPAFQITDARRLPRSIAASDSISLSYSGTGSMDTAELHIQYDLGSGTLDTVVTIVGELAPQLVARLSLPASPETIGQSSCAGTGISIPLAIAGCVPPNASLDSEWVTGSTTFQITDTRRAPRALAATDSIALGYTGTRGPDTAYVHIRYDLGSGAQDTVIAVIGSLASPLLAEPEQIHREAASAYFGQIDTLTLGVDVNASVNLDSLWPYLTDIAGTYTWDSSVVSYTTYLAPTGWSLSSITGLGDSVTFEIHKTSASVTQPLDLGTALFQPTGGQLATTWVTLAQLTMTTGGQKLLLCVTDNEDNHWAVKTLGVLAGVAEPGTGGTPALQGFVLYPNPAEDELFVQNSGEEQAAITIYDAIGRIVSTGTAEAQSTATIDTHLLASGVYFVRISCGGVMSSNVFVKE